MDWPGVCPANRTFYYRSYSLHFVIDSKGLPVEITEIFQSISNRLVGVLGPRIQHFNKFNSQHCNILHPNFRSCLLNVFHSIRGLIMRFAENFLPKTISIVIIDPTAITSDLFRQTLSTYPGYEILACPRNLDEALKIVERAQPDIAIINGSETRGPFTALTVLEELSRLDCGVRSIVLSSAATREDVVAYFRAQARGILSAELTDFTALCKCINCVHAGQIWANSEQLVYLIESLAGSKPLRIVNVRGEAILSMREEEVLHLLADGLSNRELAATLQLSEHTIKNHLFHIFDKLGVSSRTEAVLYAMNHQENRRRNAKPYVMEKTSKPHGRMGRTG